MIDCAGVCEYVIKFNFTNDDSLKVIGEFRCELIQDEPFHAKGEQVCCLHSHRYLKREGILTLTKLVYV